MYNLNTKLNPLILFTYITNYQCIYSKLVSTNYIKSFIYRIVQGCSRYSDCIFSKFNTIEPSFDLCKKVYNIPKREVYAAVRFSNKYYGDDKPKGNRIVYINGEYIPSYVLRAFDCLTCCQFNRRLSNTFQFIIFPLYSIYVLLY